MPPNGARNLSVCGGGTHYTHGGPTTNGLGGVSIGAGYLHGGEDVAEDAVYITTSSERIWGFDGKQIGMYGGPRVTDRE